jgi:hypothetical protein
MKTYDDKKDQHLDTDSDRKPAAQRNLAMFPENPFANVAYEWNNALQIAVEKMWRDEPVLHRKGS